MRIKLFLVALATLFTINAFAQKDEHEPGIYSIIGGKATPLTYSSGIQAQQSSGILGFEIGKSSVKFKGETSDVIVRDTILMVIDPEAKVIKQTPKTYFPFIKSMTPAMIAIIPLQVQKNKRVFDGGTTICGLDLEQHERGGFEWELASENSYYIYVEDLKPGEYGIAFKPAKLGTYDFAAIYAFTLAE